MKLQIKGDYVRNFEHAKSNFIFVGLLGFFGFPIYYFIWHYIWPQPYETLVGRSLCGMLFLPFIFYYKFPEKLRVKYFHHYFFLTLFTVLPFFFSFMLIRNDFSYIWMMSFFAAIFLLVFLVYNWLLIILMIIFGFVLACLVVFLFDGYLSLAGFRAEYIPVCLFVIVGSLIIQGYRYQIERSKVRDMQALGCSIAHEMRNPLMALTLIAKNDQNTIGDLITEIGGNSGNIKKESLVRMSSLCKNIMGSATTALSVAKRGANIITVTLDEVVGQQPNVVKLSDMDLKSLIDKVIVEYGYGSNEERSRVINEIEEKNSFIVKANEDLLMCLFFNLVRNALHNLKQDGLSSNFSVKIGTELVSNSKYKNYKAVYVIDNGVGIPKEILKDLFGNFSTYGKKDGVGLGLSFCKRVMKGLGGDIMCESEVGKYTKFILYFPKI